MEAAAHAEIPDWQFRNFAIGGVRRQIA